MKLTILLTLTSVSLSAASSLESRDLRIAEAAMQGDRDSVKSLIKQKADVKAAQGDGMTALHWPPSKTMPRW